MNNVFPALSLDRVPKFYQLKLQCKNASLNEKQMICEDQNIHFKYLETDFIKICVVPCAVSRCLVFVFPLNTVSFFVFGP